jgi:hypothetical protein
MKYGNYGAKSHLVPILTELRDQHVMGLLLEFVRGAMPEPQMNCAPVDEDQGADLAGARIQTRN